MLSFLGFAGEVLRDIDIGEAIQYVESVLWDARRSFSSLLVGFTTTLTTMAGTIAPLRLGHSAGAHLASLVFTASHYLRQIGLDLSIIRAVVLLNSAAYDIPAVTTLRQTATFHSRVLTDNPDTQRDASLIYHIAENTGIPSFQLFYTRGNLPERVNPVQQQQVC